MWTGIVVPAAPSLRVWSTLAIRISTNNIWIMWRIVFIKMKTIGAPFLCYLFHELNSDFRLRPPPPIFNNLPAIFKQSSLFPFNCFQSCYTAVIQPILTDMYNSCITYCIYIGYTCVILYIMYNVCITGV